MKAYKVLIVESHQIIIDVYKNTFEIVKTELKNVNFIIRDAKSSTAAIEMINNFSFNLLLLEIQLPYSVNEKPILGKNLCEQFKEKNPNAQIIVCTSLIDNFRLKAISLLTI